MEKGFRHLRKIFLGYYNFLLIALIFFFIFRPTIHDVTYVTIWKTCLIVVLVLAVFTFRHHLATKIITLLLALPIIYLSWLGEIHHHDKAFLADIFLTIIFMACAVTSILYDVILKTEVTSETLKGAICTYFLISFLFAYVYYFIELLYPGSFHLSYRGNEIYERFFSEMFYFSFITLLTIGFGDIVPLSSYAETATIIEGMMGQLYIVVFVSRLVSLHSLSSNKKLVKSLEKEMVNTPK